MSESRRVYLDNAATSWPKPDSVYDAVQRAMREVGAPAGRSSYRAAGEALRLVASARERAADLFGVGDARQIVFALNGTDALNIAIQGTLAAGDHVVTSSVEHNSVLRPLRYLQEQASVEVTRVACDRQGSVSAKAVKDALRPETRLVVISHASNVTGAIEPLDAIGELVRPHPALLLVDAAQTAGHVPCRLDELHADLLATSGHKGLLGPLGTGILALADGVESRVRPLRFGGTGTKSEEDRQPETLPERLETGNLNVPGLAGLAAGLQVVLERGVEAIGQQLGERTRQLCEGLQAIEGVTIHGPAATGARTAVVSFNVRGYDPQEVAMLLDSAYGIEVRSGLHCAPEIHRTLDTFPAGTVRMSLGIFNDEQDVELAIRAIAEISRAALPV
ncbi:MAG: aminotransferase class V-fold PLP-dependent enzyme [Planctomycetota bacterium]|nr:MAG: aminotransferase class V-fold PLP-dependent enzyme [Planctomycetota bacterium]